MAGSKPKLTLRHGAISVSVWENEHEGKKYFSAKLVKRYKDKKTDKWEDTNYLSGDDMLVAAHLLQEAFCLTCVQDDINKKEGNGEPAPF